MLREWDSFQDPWLLTKIGKYCHEWDAAIAPKTGTE